MEDAVKYEHQNVSLHDQSLVLTAHARSENFPQSVDYRAESQKECNDINYATYRKQDPNLRLWFHIHQGDIAKTDSNSV